MATPTRDEYLVLGGLLLASPAINAHGYDWVTGVAKRGDSWTVDGVEGRVAKDLIGDSLRGLIRVQIIGRYDHETGATVTNPRAGAWTTWALLQAKADVDTTQTLQLVRGGGLAALSGDAMVHKLEKLGQDDVDVWNAALDVELPDGTLA